MRKYYFAFLGSVVLMLTGSSPLFAQFGVPLGANHPELHWRQIETEHFILIYYEGLDSIAAHAAPVAEEVYRVVSTNLQTTFSSKTKIYISDNDEIKNSFAFSDDHIYIWLRGILDDLPHSVRSSGSSKWLRTVLTHEFTHIAIAHATRSWVDVIGEVDEVPRWFNEGMARYMEPDGWTTDLDMVLRVATVSDWLNFDLDSYMSGTILYEGGQSLVRYIASTYGDSSLVEILHHRSTFGLYDFDAAVQFATKHSLRHIYNEWHKYLIVYYGTSYGQHREVNEVGKKLPSGLDIIESARLDPTAKRIALLGKESEASPFAIYVMQNDTLPASLLLNQPGIEPYLSWTSDGKGIVFSKLRFGKHADLEYDLYRVDVASGEWYWLTTDGHYEFPDVAHHSDRIAAVHTIEGGAELQILDGNGRLLTTLTHFNDPNVQLYAPRWSPDDSNISISIFEANGKRDIAVFSVATAAAHRVASDSVNDRYAIWSPKGDSLIYVSHASGIPNLYRLAFPSGAKEDRLSDVASDIQAWDWSSRTDSLLVTSFDGRNRVGLYWYPVNHVYNSASIGAVSDAKAEPKYGAWRTVRWPLITRTEDSIPSISYLTPTNYNSLAHISPLLFFPILGTDRDQDGDAGWRVGLSGVASDPMLKHTLSGFADWGNESHRFGYDVGYANNQLGFSIIGERGNVLNFAGVINQRGYYQLEDRYGISLGLGIPDPDDLTKMNLLSLGWKRRALIPWNIDAYNVTPVELKPIAVTLNEFSFDYHFVSRDLLASLLITHANTKLGSDLTFTRFRFFSDLKFPFETSGDAVFAVTTNAVAQQGAILPQEFVGFTPYDFLQGGFTLTNISSEYRLRGIRRYYYGNRMVMFSPELRTALVHNGPVLVEFLDMGSVWFANVPSNNPNAVVTPLGKTVWLKTSGVEVRVGLEGVLAASLGVAWELIHTAQPDWYFRVTGGL